MGNTPTPLEYSQKQKEFYLQEINYDSLYEKSVLELQNQMKQCNHDKRQIDDLIKKIRELEGLFRSMSDRLDDRVRNHKQYLEANLKLVQEAVDKANADDQKQLRDFNLDFQKKIDEVRAMYAEGRNYKRYKDEANHLLNIWPKMNRDDLEHVKVAYPRYLLYKSSGHVKISTWLNQTFKSFGISAGDGFIEAFEFFDSEFSFFKILKAFLEDPRRQFEVMDRQLTDDDKTSVTTNIKILDDSIHEIQALDFALKIQLEQMTGTSLAELHDLLKPILIKLKAALDSIEKASKTISDKLKISPKDPFSTEMKNRIENNLSILRNIDFEPRLRNAIACLALRKGDIISRTMDGIPGSHYAILGEYLGDCRFEMIEKDKDSFSSKCVRYSILTITDLLKGEKSGSSTDGWYLLTDCRFEDTFNMAKHIYDKGLDAGYCVSHSNCQHFATFCLTRSSEFSDSGQTSFTAVSRVAVGVPFGGAIVGLKTLTHPVYKLFNGEMDLAKRAKKTFVPVMLDSEAVVKGYKIVIGFPLRLYAHDKFDHEKSISNEMFVDWFLTGQGRYIDWEEGTLCSMCLELKQDPLLEKGTRCNFCQPEPKSQD